MEPLQCFVIVIIALCVGYFAGRARDYLCMRIEADKQAREFRQMEQQAEAKIIGKK